MGKYGPKDCTKSPRYCNIRTFMLLPYLKTLDDVDFVVAGVPYDTACTTRAGARFGPAAIRDASMLLRPHNPDMDISIFDYLSGVDYGDIDIVPDDIETSYTNIYDEAFKIYQSGVKPIFLGGDHSISLPLIRAAKDVFGPVALVHFDSHSDTDDNLWGRKYMHATPFRRAAEEDCLSMDHSIQIGIRGPIYGSEGLKDAEDLGFEVLTRRKMRKMGLEASIEKIRNRVQGATAIYVTFDIDFLDPAYAPGTGTMEVGGFTTWEAIEIIRDGLKGLNIVGFDLVEVLPAYDSPGQITSCAASNIVYEFITLLALNKKSK
ncbi:MAG: agmatinase [Clostridia bacterium]|nr:agmatinase [Clostridia bacterium]